MTATQLRATLGVGVALGLAALTVRPAVACNEWTGRVEIAAATADGTFIQVSEYSGGFGFAATVEARGRDGATLARCRRSDGGDDDRWHCQGAARLRATGSEHPARVVARWSTILGATTPTLVPRAVPVGITAALCSRFRVTLQEEPIGCSHGNAEVVALAGSSMWFVRASFAEPFCGSTSSFDGVAVSLDTASLRARLVHRAAVFDRRHTARATARAGEARAALQWLDTAAVAP